MIYFLKTKDKKYTDQFLITSNNEKELLQKIEDIFSGIKATIKDNIIILKGIDEIINEDEANQILIELEYNVDKFINSSFTRFKEEGVILFEVIKIESLDQLEQIIDPGKELGSIE